AGPNEPHDKHDPKPLRRYRNRLRRMIHEASLRQLLETTVMTNSDRLSLQVVWPYLVTHRLPPFCCRRRGLFRCAGAAVAPATVLFSVWFPEAAPAKTGASGADGIVWIERLSVGLVIVALTSP